MYKKSLGRELISKLQRESEFRYSGARWQAVALKQCFALQICREWINGKLGYFELSKYKPFKTTRGILNIYVKVKKTT